MRMPAVVLTGTAYGRGVTHGRLLRDAVRSNLGIFWRGIEAKGWSRSRVLAEGRRARHQLPEGTGEEIDGIAAGAGLEREELLAYNLFHGHVFPDDCTVMIALPDATAAGRTILLKNSDKIGRDDMVGENFYQHKEINVLMVVVGEDGPSLLGVGSAGGTGFKMGVNDLGVAAGCNIARTRELNEGKVSTSSIRALDRVQLVREGLAYGTALGAACYVSGKLAQSPMSTPGNLEFADSKEAIVLEGSYDRQAMQVYRQGVVARANRFQTLESMNNPEDVSSYCRYYRSMELMRAELGRLTPEHFIRFSMDHGNGPGPNSICRHGYDYHEETSQSAMVVELDPGDPTRTRAWVALGKPCHAWRKEGGHLSLDMRLREQEIPGGFVNGATWREFWTEEPYVEAVEERV